MQIENSTATPIHPAATVVLLRDRPTGLETLLLRRNSRLGFAGGAWVFPGGRIDPVELAAATDSAQAARIAAVRETQEEAALTVTPESLVYYAHWTTPAIMPKRFATWFFLVDYQGNADVCVDGGEIHAHRWSRPVEALDAHASGDIEMMPPTYVTLRELQDCSSASEAIARAGQREPPIYVPRSFDQDGKFISLYFGDAG